MDVTTGRTVKVTLASGTSTVDLDAGLFKNPTAIEGSEEPEAEKQL